MIRHLLVAVALVAAPFAADAQQWVEGQHYRALSNPQPPEQAGTIEVAEFFWYGCPSCYALEPHLRTWLETKPADVVFTRYAASLSQAWRVHARAYYTAESLGVVDQVHGALFDAIHQNRRPLADAKEIGEVFQKAAGIDADTFQRAYDSFGVETRLRKGDQLSRRFQINGVPTLIVNGKWVTSPTMAQGYDRAIAVVNHLVEMERGGPAPAAGAADAPADDAAAAPQREPAASEAASAVSSPANGDGEGGAAEMWWLWLVGIVVVVAVIAVAVRSRRD